MKKKTKANDPASPVQIFLAQLYTIARRAQQSEPRKGKSIERVRKLILKEAMSIVKKGPKYTDPAFAFIALMDRSYRQGKQSRRSSD